MITYPPFASAIQLRPSLPMAAFSLMDGDQVVIIYGANGLLRIRILPYQDGYLGARLSALLLDLEHTRLRDESELALGPKNFLRNWLKDLIQNGELGQIARTSGSIFYRPKLFVPARVHAPVPLLRHTALSPHSAAFVPSPPAPAFFPEEPSNIFPAPIFGGGSYTPFSDDEDDSEDEAMVPPSPSPSVGYREVWDAN